jgi:hypothetical protein
MSRSRFFLRGALALTLARGDSEVLGPAPRSPTI